MKRSQPNADKATICGRFVVADPRICHGKPTFRGTRIMVSQVLDQVASGLSWTSISEEWDGRVSIGAIGEAVRLARDSVLTYGIPLPKSS